MSDSQRRRLTGAPTPLTREEEEARIAYLESLSEGDLYQCIACGRRHRVESNEIATDFSGEPLEVPEVFYNVFCWPGWFFTIAHFPKWSTIPRVDGETADESHLTPPV